MTDRYLQAVVFASIACAVYATSPPIVTPSPEKTYCPKDESIKDFDITKILGDWIVVETSTSAPLEVRVGLAPIKCQLFNIKDNGNSYLLTHYFGVKPHSYDHKYNIIEEDRHLVEKSHAPIEEIMFAVPLTDYENFAVVITCEQNRHFHRTAHVLIKDPKSHSKQQYIEKAHESLKAHQFDAEQMQEVNQENCN